MKTVAFGRVVEVLSIDEAVVANVEDEAASDMDGERSGIDGTSSGDVHGSKRVEAARLTTNNWQKMQDGNETTHLCRPRHPTNL